MAAPVAFLLAATVAVLLVRSALRQPDATPAPAPKVKKHRKSRPAVVPLATTTTPRQVVTQTATASGGTYTIASGDTLATIAAKQGTTVDALLAANPDVDPTNLQIGQEIALP